jgi:hypothetical protein
VGVWFLERVKSDTEQEKVLRVTLGFEKKSRKKSKKNPAKILSFKKISFSGCPAAEKNSFLATQGR